MRVLLLGAEGMLGSDLTATVPPTVELHCPRHRDLDITDERALTVLVDRLQPGAVINAAAYTRVDRAEAERTAAFAVNAAAVAALGRICAARDTLVVHFSTDYVFDGAGERPYAEDDAAAPVNVYGESKLAGELGLAASGAPALIIRTQWLFGRHGRSFPRTMWERARRREPTRVVSDQRGRPTYSEDLATVTWRLLDVGASGIIHAANEGEMTWFAVADRVFRAAGSRDVLSACTTSEFPTPARRPTYTALDTSKLERVLGVAMPSAEDALDRFLMLLRAEQDA